MGFSTRGNDWRQQPVEVRELLLGELRQRATASPDQVLSPLELAEQVGIVPDPWQRDLLIGQDRQTILLCARQTGKSTISALIALHTALYTPNSLCLVLSPSQRQSMETYRKVRDFYNSLSGVPEALQESG